VLEGIKTYNWGTLILGVVVGVIGFLSINGWQGWLVTNGTALQMAETALEERNVEICVAQIKNSETFVANKDKLNQETSSYKRDALFREMKLDRLVDGSKLSSTEVRECLKQITA